MKHALICLLILHAQPPALGPEKEPLRDIPFVAPCDGTEQRYVLMLPEPFESDRPHDVLIALHGHGSDRWQFEGHARRMPRGP